MSRASPPRVVLLLDRPDWAFDHQARAIAERLSDEFEFRIAYVSQRPDLNAWPFDLIYVFFWGETYHRKFVDEPRRVIKQIASQRWEGKPYGPLSAEQVAAKWLVDAGTVAVVSRRLESMFSPHREVLLTRSGFEPREFFPPDARRGALRIGWAGNLADPCKGVNDILRPAAGNDFELLLAGGQLSHGQMAEFYRSIDVLCVASTAEGLPLTLIEGMACGCFPVCVDVGIVPEVVRHGENGLIVERTVPAFRSAFQWCARELDRVREAGRRNAAEMVRSRSWDQLTDDWRIVLRRAGRQLSSRPAPVRSAGHHPRPEILFIVDLPNWAHDIKTGALQRALKRHYRIVKRYQAEVSAADLEQADLIVVYYWQQLLEMARLEAEFVRYGHKFLIGICSSFELDGQRRAPGLAILQQLPWAVFVLNAALYREFEPLLAVPVYYTPNGVDTDFFRPARGNAAAPAELRVGWAGSLGNLGPELRGFHDLIVPAVESVDGARLLTAIREQEWRGPAEMLEFYRSLDVYVCASRLEGTPNPCLEAAACGVPLVTTRVGNMPELIRDHVNGMFVEPDAADIARALTELRDDPDLRAHLGRSLRRSIQNWSWKRQALNYRRMFEAVLAHRPSRAPGSARRGPPRALPSRSPPLRVVWEGAQFVHHSLAIINRELCWELLRSQRVDLSLIPSRPEEIAARADPRWAPLAWRIGPPGKRPIQVHVRHFWPPLFEPPAEGHWVIMQSWEYGSLPKSWVEPMNALVDEVWVPSRYVRDCYLRSGVEPSKVVVVRNSVDPERFHPTVPPLSLQTRKAFRFLFVGGTIPRKGADILLETYVATFGPEDDVCLVVQDFGVDSFYRGQDLRAEIRRLQSDPRSPEILYRDQPLQQRELAGLYTACQCLVHPYRGEALPLPNLEAMACGLPIIVPEYGGSLDVCDASVAYLVPAVEVRVPRKHVGELETVDYIWWAEVDRAALARAMRRAVEQRDEARALGLRASARVRSGFTWKHAAGVVLERLEDLARRPIQRFAKPAGKRPAAKRAARRQLSVCMIARDEETYLSQCLDSVRQVADEIVVVDTGSTDRTVAVAGQYGAKVSHFPWGGDFAAARNESLRHATKEWILVLDADETLAAGSGDEIRRLLETDLPAGFLLRIVSPIDSDEQSSVVDHFSLRLFRNRPQIRFRGRIHEQVAGCSQTAAANAVIEHHGYRTAATRRQKAERARALLERAIREEPDDPFHAYNLGITYRILGRTADAERQLRRVIQSWKPVAGGTCPEYLVGAYTALATVLTGAERYLEAREACQAALRIAPNSPDAEVTLAAAELRLGNLQAALQAYERALRCRADYMLGPTDRATAGWKAHLGMGEVHLLSNQPAKALVCLEAARTLCPENPAIRIQLARACQRLGLERQGEEHLHAASACFDQPDRFLAVVRAIARDDLEAALLEVAFLRRSGRTDRALELAGRLRQSHPGSPLPALAEGSLFMANDQLDEALECFAHALQLDDTNPITLHHLGVVLLGLECTREAEQAFLAAVTLQPEYPDAQQGLLDARARAGSSSSSE